MWLNKAVQHWTKLPRLARIAVPILVGTVAGLGQAPFNLPLISLLAFATAFGFLFIAETPRQAAGLGWLFGLGYFALTLQWLVSPFLVEPEIYGWMAPFAVFFMSGGLALFWAISFGASKRIGAGALVVTLPLAELARAYVFTGFPWGMPSYGLVNAWFGQLAGVVGSHGLNVLFVIVAYALFHLAYSQAKWMSAPIALAGVVALWPLSEATKVENPIGTIRLIQPNAPQHQKWDPAFAPIFFDRALEFTAAKGEPDLVIWPETSFPASLPGGEWIKEQIIDVAAGNPVVFGANRFDGVEIYNAAVLMNGQGELVQTYDKYHLVPFGEYMPFGELLSRFGIHGLAASEGRGFSAGPGAELMDLGLLGKALPLICYEAVFPQDVGAAVERPGFLMQITNDAWFGNFSGPHQHLAQARMRSIEQGLPMVRAANTGISALIDEKGRVLKALPLNEAGYIDVALPTAKQATLYSRSGDLPVALLLIMGLIGFGVRAWRIKLGQIN